MRVVGSSCERRSSDGRMRNCEHSEQATRDDPSGFVSSWPKSLPGIARALASDLALSHRAAIGINESHEFSAQVGEQLQLSGVQRLTQELKQKDVSTAREGRSKTAEEKPETAGGIYQERKTGIVDPCRELHDNGTQSPQVTQGLGEFERRAPANSLK